MDTVSLIPDCFAAGTDSPTLEDSVSHVLVGELDDVAALLIENNAQTWDGTFEKNHGVAAALAGSAD